MNTEMRSALLQILGISEDIVPGESDLDRVRRISKTADDLMKGLKLKKLLKPPKKSGEHGVFSPVTKHSDDTGTDKTKLSKHPDDKTPVTKVEKPKGPVVIPAKKPGQHPLSGKGSHDTTQVTPAPGGTKVTPIHRPTAGAIQLGGDKEVVQKDLSPSQYLAKYGKCPDGYHHDDVGNTCMKIQADCNCLLPNLVSEYRTRREYLRLSEQTVRVFEEQIVLRGSALDESKFNNLVGALAKKGARNPSALAYAIGVKKYGKEEMARRSAAGRKAKQEALNQTPEEHSDVAEYLRLAGLVQPQGGWYIP